MLQTSLILMCVKLAGEAGIARTPATSAELTIRNSRNSGYSGCINQPETKLLRLYQPAGKAVYPNLVILKLKRQAVCEHTLSVHNIGWILMLKRQLVNLVGLTRMQNRTWSEQICRRYTC